MTHTGMQAHMHHHTDTGYGTPHGSMSGLLSPDLDLPLDFDALDDLPSTDGLRGFPAPSHPPSAVTPHTHHSTISETMRLVTDPADFLGTPHRFVSNFSLVNDTLNYLTPANSVIFIGSQKLNFNGSSRPNVQQQGPEPLPWPPQLTEVCYFTVSGLLEPKRCLCTLFCQHF